VPSPEFDPARLIAALDCVPAGAWSLPSTFAETRVHHGYRRIVLVQVGHPLPAAAPFAFVLDELAPVHAAWLSWIGPGGFIVPHRDAGPWRERWQVPIRAAGAFHMGGDFEPVNGRAFPVSHWEPHAVTNRTDRPRLHLVVDRDVWLDYPAAPFETFEVPESMTDLVSAAQHT
jgi:hypothetical protein